MVDFILNYFQMMGFINYKNADVDVSEGIDVNKTNAPKKGELCHYWFFKDIGFLKNMSVINVMIY